MVEITFFFVIQRRVGNTLICLVEQVELGEVAACNRDQCTILNEIEQGSRILVELDLGICLQRSKDKDCHNQ